MLLCDSPAQKLQMSTAKSGSCYPKQNSPGAKFVDTQISMTAVKD